MYPSLIEIGSDGWEKLCTNKQTDRQTDRHYENNGHLAVNQYDGDVYDERHSFILSHICTAR